MLADMPGVYQYKAYGLGFHSQLPLADFPIQEATGDVQIRLAEIDNDMAKSDLVHTYRKLYPDHALISIEDVGLFQVNQGREILVHPFPNADGRLVQRYLLGSIMAILLSQRERLVLHASVIDLAGRGIAFLGASGAGKSSTAAAFLSRGYPILVDDIAAIELTEESAHLYPAFPQLKLSRQAVQAIGVDPKRLYYLDDLEDKLSFRIIQPISDLPVQLKRIYMITDGSQIEFQQLTSQQAVVELVRYTMPSSFIHLDYESHFRKCVSLVNQVEIFRLIRPDSLPQLNELTRMVEEHCDYLN